MQEWRSGKACRCLSNKAARVGKFPKWRAWSRMEDASKFGTAMQKSRPRARGGRGVIWRETKVGCLLSMRSETSPSDPCPTIPEIFVDPRRMGQISREIKGFSAVGEAAAGGEPSEPPAPKKRPGQPEVLVRSVVATREKVEAFGKQLAAAAWRRGFMAAERKAFVARRLGDELVGVAASLSHFTPIVDFIHALCYVFAGAMAGRATPEAWPAYCQWAQWLWSGRVELVIAALRDRQQVLGLPEANDPEESSRCKVAEALCYLENQRSRMQYDEYRRQGLPITSSHIESTIKQINRRVKGTEKFWSNGGAEALLQLAADYLSETAPLATYWRERANQATGQRHYQIAG